MMMAGVPNLRITPLAARIAAARGIDVSRVRGSGFEGKIVASDLERTGLQEQRPSLAGPVPVAQEAGEPHGTAEGVYAGAAEEAGRGLAMPASRPAGAAAADGEGELLAMADALRGFAARAAREAGTAAPATQYVEADVTALLGLQKKLNDGNAPKEGSGTSLASFYRKASSLCVRSGALVGAEIAFSDMSGVGLFAFTPQIEPPAVAALGVGAPYRRLVMTASGIENRWFVMQSFTFDKHMVGEPEAAAFQRRLKALIEAPEGILR